jgi:hypothetical protein
MGKIHSPFIHNGYLVYFLGMFCGKGPYERFEKGFHKLRNPPL